MPAKPTMKRKKHTSETYGKLDPECKCPACGRKPIAEGRPFIVLEDVTMSMHDPEGAGGASALIWREEFESGSGPRGVACFVECYTRILLDRWGELLDEFSPAPADPRKPGPKESTSPGGIILRT